MSYKQAEVSEIIDNIRRIFQVITEKSNRVAHETGLTGPQLWVVKILEETSPLKVSDLAHRMYLHPATMVGLLDRLEGKNLVIRTRSETDRRVVYIDLTEHGRELVRKSPEVVQSLLVKGLEALAEQKLGNISTGLEQVVKILGAQSTSPQLIMSPEINMPKRRKRKVAS
ncbi:MAG: MarR family transcriptional regulator [Desulfuromonadaceae bacterium]|nr:MarR family transcriptional regulator [Desulfuromonadaceae bacterium]